MRRTPALALLVLAVLAALPGTARAASGGDYLASRLTLSGGIAEAGTSTPSVSLTEWSVMGLTAAGRRPWLMHRTGGHTPLYFLAVRAKSWSSTFELARGILAAEAMGRNPYLFGGRNLVAALRRGIHPATGQIGSYANSTYWSVLALKAAGSPIPVRTINYIRARQWANGGYGWAPGVGPDSNDTAAAIMALRVYGIPCSWNAVRHGYDFLRSLYRADHGYALYPGHASDSQSTSWAIQARRKCSLDNSAALSYLRARQLSSGAFNYQPGRTLTPAWVTAQVLPATNGRSYPIKP
ncbi:MAG TPA: prenyltransferase/squalene oxidase repeat-containing protein [Gaiellales bacterium]|jgi:hypothetical protein|nr:prenyltransferase/squalene oxidase repeat-containing protein [Gaiellales bacterium]